MAANEIQFQLNDDQLDYLKKVHNAKAIRELTMQPGWPIFQMLITDMVERLETQHLNLPKTNVTKDAYWANGLRLDGAREFAKVLQEKIVQQVSILQQPLELPKPFNVADLDGEFNPNMENE